MGVTASSDDCFLGLRGLRTLATRLARQQASGIKVARMAARAARGERSASIRRCPARAATSCGSAISRGATSLFGVVLHPVAKERIDAMLDGMRLFGMGWSWGGFESLIIPIYPERTRTVTRWEAGGPCLRLYVGLEDPDDLIADLADGLRAPSAAHAACVLAEIDRLHARVGADRVGRALRDDRGRDRARSRDRRSRTRRPCRAR